MNPNGPHNKPQITNLNFQIAKKRYKLFNPFHIKSCKIFENGKWCPKISEHWTKVLSWGFAECPVTKRPVTNLLLKWKLKYWLAKRDILEKYFPGCASFGWNWGPPRLWEKTFQLYSQKVIYSVSDFLKGWIIDMKWQNNK